MELPEIIKDRMDLKISDQLSIILFPDDEGQPSVDVIKVKLTEVDRKEYNIYITPCEAMELASGLNMAVQMYLYNQEQYREEILEPRMKLVKKRESDAV
jgi:hypothetical protein